MNDDVFDIPFEHLGLVLPVAVAFGGGLNSTALLVRWTFDELPRPGRVWFADTGGERPEVYEHIARFSDWLVREGMPTIEIIKKGGRVETLEENCLRMEMLPSLAYGMKGCSHKYKIEPQEREMNRWPEARAAWKVGAKVVKIIGYGAEEKRRLAKAKIEDEKCFYRFPLNEWGMDRAACERAIRRVGLKVPGKSSCFFCPAHTKPEIAAMRTSHPVLLQRALKMEATAIASGKLQTSKGLGRQFAWGDFLAGLPTPEGDKTAPCMVCIDQ